MKSFENEGNNFASLDFHLIARGFQARPQTQSSLQKPQKQEEKENLDVKEEAKKLAAAWKQIEAEAELIKQKALNKKDNSKNVKEISSTSKSQAKITSSYPLNKPVSVNTILKQESITKKSHTSKGPRTNLEVFKMTSSKNSQQKNVKKLNPSSNSSGFQNDLEGLTASIPSVQNSKYNARISELSLPNDQNNNPNFSEMKNESLDYSNTAFSLTFTENQNSKALFGFPTEFNNNENELQNIEGLMETGNFGSTPQKEKPDFIEITDLTLTEQSINRTAIFPGELNQSNSYNLSDQKQKQIMSEKYKMDEMLSRLQKDHEQNKLTLLQFRLDKLSSKLGKVVLQANTRQKSFSFLLLKEVFKEEKLKWLKATLINQLKTKSLYFCFWNMYILQKKLEKDQINLELEKQKEETQYNQAINFYEKTLLRKYFVNGFLKSHYKLVQEKNLKEGQSHLKTAVSSFINQLKSRINNNDQTASLAPNLEASETTERKYSSSQMDKISESDRNYEEMSIKSNLEERDTKITDQVEFNKGEEELTSIQSSLYNQSFDTRKANNNSEKKVIFQKNDSKENSSKETVQTLEQRAKERKQKLDEIKKKHEEAKIKKEQEKKELELKEKESLRRRKIEEKEAFERKRREEFEAIERKNREKEEYLLKLDKASKLRNTLLLRNYGIRGLKKLMELREIKQIQAENFYTLKLSELFFKMWNKAVEMVIEEKDLALAPKIKMAELTWHINLQRKVFKAFFIQRKQILEKNKMCDQQRGKVLKQNCFLKWCQIIPDLKKDKFEYEEKYNNIIVQFRHNVLSKKVFNCLKMNSQEEAKERMKKKHKEAMWGKVNSWLTDYKNHKNDDFKMK